MPVELSSINYELLKTFVAAGRGGTFAAAAAERRVTVSAVSQQMKTLEAQLGVPLFERLGRRVRLTEAGRRLLGTLREELERIDAALERVVADRSEIAGTVRIGAPRTFGRHWLMPRVAALLDAHAAVRIDVAHAVPSVLERQLVDGRLDLAVFVRPTTHDALAYRKIATESFVAVASRAYVEREGAPRDLAAFQRHRYIVFDDDLAMHAPWWRASFGARAALPERVVCAVESLEGMLELALRGAAIAVLPDYLVERPLRDGHLVALAPARARQRSQNTIFLAWRTSAVASARVTTVREALG